MAVLADADRFDCWAEFMRRCTAEGITVSVSKTALRALFDAADDWVSANQASYNTALPQPGRGALSTSAKSLILEMVLEKRYRKGV